MVYQTKRKILNSTIYIVLGLVIVAVICITVATFVGMRSKKTPPVDDPTGESAAQSPDESPQAQQGGLIDKPSPAPVSQTPQKSKTPGGETPAIEPVDPVYFLPACGTLLKEYSPEMPVKSLTMNDYRTHTGIDISAPVGTAVAALSDGTVLDIWNDPMMGMCLSIDHGNGLLSVYKNLDAIFPSGVTKGATVKAGQTVAAIGNTCLIELADTDHLHFEIRLNGKHVDPAAYIDMAALAAVDGGED